MQDYLFIFPFKCFCDVNVFVLLFRELHFFKPDVGVFQIKYCIDSPTIYIQVEPENAESGRAYYILPTTIIKKFMIVLQFGIFGCGIGGLKTNDLIILPSSSIIILVILSCW